MIRLKNLVELVSKQKLVLDLSCRKKSGDEANLYYIVTNKWTKYTDLALTYVY